MTGTARARALIALRLAGPAGALALHLAGDGPAMSMAGVAFWVALWWVTEAMPLAATSLLPAVLLPLFGVASTKVAAGAYMDRFIMLMMAGFMAALAIERAGLHRRLALLALLAIGTTPRRLVLGVLLVTALASAWIANTAATLIMLPIALALAARLEADGTLPSPASARAFTASLCLAIAYGASIGGTMTPIGTPTNLIYLGAVQKDFGGAPSFLEWMLFAVPISALMLAVTGLWFMRRLPRAQGGGAGPRAARRVLRDELAALGRMRGAERRVAWIFGLMVLLWVTRDIDTGGGEHVGWAPLLGLDALVDDATVAVGGTIALFAWRAPPREGGAPLLDWETARRIPWEVVLLFGGGLALAKGFDLSGLSARLGEAMSAAGALPPLLAIAATALVVTFLTEVTSNTAITTLLMPILAPVAAASGAGPEVLMLPAALAANCAFMLPVATPPNAIVYGMGRVTMPEMARTGLALNLAGVAIITLVLGLRAAL
jgi:sodium-dependent dicarboxylate transporter 2/3/5